MASSNALILALFLAINTVLPTFAKDYTVGETSGWAIGVDYGTWASGKTFTVGDTLVFNFGAGHTVDEVKKSDYKACTTGNSLSTDSSGATTITLKTAGTHYFICASPGHCDGGMKLAVTVKAGKAPAPAGAPSSAKGSAVAPSSAKGSPSDGSSTTTSPKTTTPASTSASSTTSNTSSGTSRSRSPIAAMFIVSWISYCVLSLV